MQQDFNSILGLISANIGNSLILAIDKSAISLTTESKMEVFLKTKSV